MKIISLLLIFITAQAWGYSKKNVNLTDFEFNRYVRPQLSSIQQDYHTLLTLMNPDLKVFKPLFNAQLEMASQARLIQVNCQKKNSKVCKKALSSLLEILRSSIKLLEVQNSFHEKEYYKAENMLIAFQTYTKLTNHLYDTYIKVENFNFFYRADTHNISNAQEVFSIVLEVQNLFNIYLIKSSDYRFQEDFMSFWSDFIKPVSNIILPKNDKRLFINKMNIFNLRLNFLNVMMTKRNQKISKPVGTLLKVIHRRWNNILKVSLRR